MVSLVFFLGMIRAEANKNLDGSLTHVLKGMHFITKWPTYMHACIYVSLKFIYFFIKKNIYKRFVHFKTVNNISLY